MFAVGGTWARTNLPAAVATTSYDAANRLTQWGAATLTYDFNGNLTNDDTKTYTWSVRDQLLSMTGASFQYDALGRRHRRVVGSTTRDFVYDGLNQVQGEAEHDGQGERDHGARSAFAKFHFGHRALERPLNILV